MSENHAGPTAGLVSQPGQYEKKTTTEKTELWLVLRQAITLAIIGDVMLSIVGAGLVIVGPQAVAIIGGTVGMALAVAAWWLGHWDGVIALLLGSALAAAGVAIGNWLGPVLWQFVIASPKYALIPYALPWLLAGAAAYWRILTEIFDPNYPAPRQAIARTRPLTPWSKETQDLPEEMEAAPEQVIERHETVVKVSLGDNGSYDKATLPMHPNVLKRLAEIAVKDGIAESKMSGSGKPLTGRNEFHDFRNTLLEWGWIVWNNPNAPQQGLSLTRRGQQICGRLSGNSSPP